MRTTRKFRLMPIVAFALSGMLSATSAQQVDAQGEGGYCGVGEPSGPFYVELPGSWRLPAYTGLSNNALLSVGQDDFGNFGIVTHGNQDSLFRVPNSTHTGINDKLTTVGTSLVAGRYVGWIRTRDGRVRTFIQPGADVFLNGINNNDVAVGSIRLYPGYLHPVIADENGLRVVDLPGLPHVNDAWFNDINDSGAIVGAISSWDESGYLTALRGFRFQDNRVTPIEREGMVYIEPMAINNRGQIAGIWSNYIGYDGWLSEWDCFIRDRDGDFRTADFELPFPETVNHNGTWALNRQQPTILDMNDRGQLLIRAEAYYVPLELEGWIEGYSRMYAIVNPTH